jgi:Ser/Thr protein kinase RdoA (MazF antagonist)
MGNLAEHQWRNQSYTGELAGLVGDALGYVHGTLSKFLSDQDLRRALPGQAPWVLTLQYTGLDYLRPMGSGPSALADRLAQSPELLSLLAYLGLYWERGTLIHGDFKWENCLLMPPDSEQPRLKIIDWELVDSGDGAWDVATILKEYVLVGMFTSGGGDLDLRSMHQAINSFWRRYVATRRFMSASEEHWALQRSIAFAGARLVASVLEYSQFVGRLDEYGVRLLDLAFAILTKPEWAASTLFAMV